MPTSCFVQGSRAVTVCSRLLEPGFNILLACLGFNWSRSLSHVCDAFVQAPLSSDQPKWEQEWREQMCRLHALLTTQQHWWRPNCLQIDLSSSWIKCEKSFSSERCFTSTIQHHNFESSNQLLMQILILLRWTWIINFCIESAKAMVGGGLGCL